MCAVEHNAASDNKPLDLQYELCAVGYECWQIAKLPTGKRDAFAENIYWNFFFELLKYSPILIHSMEIVDFAVISQINSNCWNSFLRFLLLFPLFKLQSYYKSHEHI